MTSEFFLLFLRSISYLWLLTINIRREDRSPGSSSRVYSCHFRDGLKVIGPEIFKRNADKLFPNNKTRTPKRTKTKKSTLEDDKGLMMVSDIISQYNESCSASTSNAEASQASQEPKRDAQIVLLQTEPLENVREELKETKLKEHYQREMIRLCL